MISLIDMPEVAMKIILEKLEYCEIQCFRKTCNSLRHFIDDTRPEQSITVLETSGSLEKFSLLIYGKEDPQLYPNGQRIHIEYQELEGENTRITWFRKDKYWQKTILNENFSDIFFRDFGLILECKLRILTQFLINFKQMRKGFLEKLLKKEHPLKVRSLTLRNATCQGDILEVLQYTSADTLEKLEIALDIDWKLPWIGRMDISKIVELEQWKNAKEVHVVGGPVSAGIQNFEHFSFVNVPFGIVTLRDMLRLKELFLHTPYTFKQFRINFQKLSDRDAFSVEFGPPIDRTATYYDVRKKTLIFKRPDDKENVVTIGFFPNFFEFRIIKKCDVSNDVEVVN